MKYLVWCLVFFIFSGCQTDNSALEHEKLPDLIITNVESEYFQESDSISTNFTFNIEIKNVGDKNADGTFVITCELPNHSKTGTVHTIDLLEQITTNKFLAFGTDLVTADSIINNGVTVRINDPLSSDQAKIKEQNYDNNRYTVQF